jgi:hypothetical protein
MATRSAIGYALSSGKVRAVYCHWNGCPSHQLPILEEHYGTLHKVQALIRPGSMSSLRTIETWDRDCRRDAQPLYHRERGVGPWCAGDGSDYAQPPQTTNPTGATTTENFWRDHGCEHLYVFRPGYGWFHYAL